MRRRRTSPKQPLLVAAALAAFSPLQAQDPNPLPAGGSVEYRYAVKVVCSTDGSIDFDGGGSVLGRTEDVLVDADLFQTAVNVLNPWSSPISVAVEIALARPVEGLPIRGTVASDLLLEPGDAVELDCGSFRSAITEGVPGGTGFALIHSPVRLQVAAVYTVLEKSDCSGGGPRDVLEGRGRGGTSCRGAGVSLDVEYVEPIVVSVAPEVPDLVVALTGRPSERCGVEQCALTVPFEIANLGAASVETEFEVHVFVTNAAAGHSPYVHHHVGGVLAGERIPLAAGEIVTEGSCFAPACQVLIRVDATGLVAESDETNNQDAAVFFN